MRVVALAFTVLLGLVAGRVGAAPTDCIGQSADGKAMCVPPLISPQPSISTCIANNNFTTEAAIGYCLSSLGIVAPVYDESVRIGYVNCVAGRLGFATPVISAFNWRPEGQGFSTSCGTVVTTHRYGVEMLGAAPNELMPSFYNVYSSRARTAICRPGEATISAGGDIAYCVPPSTNSKSCTVGNPCLPDTGIKVESSLDYEGAGAHPLRFERHYRSMWYPQRPRAGLGPDWGHTYARTVYTSLGSIHGVGYVWVIRHTGDVSIYHRAGGATAWTAATPTRDVLQERLDAGGVRIGWTLRIAQDDSVETYGVDGKLLSIAERNSWTTTLTWSTSSTPATTAPEPGYLIAIRNHFGRELRLVYDAQGRLTQLLPPGAVQDAGAGLGSSPIRYAYDEPESFAAGVPVIGQLTSVTWQDGALRRYHHESQAGTADIRGLLTGITDETGVRYSTYTYANRGKVQTTERAGGSDRVRFAYHSGAAFTPPGGDFSAVTIEDYPGGVPRTRVMSFTRIGNTRFPTTLSAPCAPCGNTQPSTSYAADGNVTKTIGHDGKPTFYQYDSKRRETERATFTASYAEATTRPALSAAESVTSTSWHSAFNLPAQIVGPRRYQGFTYDAKGNITLDSDSETTDPTGATKWSAVRIDSTRKRTYWSYNASSLPTTVRQTTGGDGNGVGATEVGRWTLTYNGTGDVATIKDVPRNLTGQVTQYDAQGRVLAATSIDGDAISLAYTPRGFVSSRTEVDKTNAYVQNAIGLTTEVRLPDGQVASFEYSAAHRLTAVRLNGALLASAVLRDGVPGNPIATRTVELLERLLGAVLRPAHAQTAAAAAPSFGSVAPAMGLPGQPGVNASAILMGDDRPGNASPAGLLPRFDPATRRLAEVLTSLCRCDPSGGYGQPKLTALSMIHIVISGHTAPVYRNKSYFSEPVNQALVDDIVSRSGGKPFMRQGSEDVYYVADMGRSVGFKRGTDGMFAPTRDVTLRVHADNCDNLLRVRQEVITMYPGRP